MDSKERMVPKIDLNLDDLPIEKTLGVHWDSESDHIVFKLRPIKDVHTKREILSEVTSFFDPLGFLAPIILSAKILLQRIWREGFQWQETLPAEILNEWKSWTSDLDSIKLLKLPRCLMGTVVNPVHRSLHVFTDASENGFGAVVYIRISNGEDVDVNFVIAKARVAPIKFMPVPRLELQGTVVGVRLATSICKVLKLPLSVITCWTDSTTVLQWLYSKKYRFQTFVANRVSEILENSSCRQWRHVPGRLNPANECSRGMSATGLSSQHRWFTGPNESQKTSG